MAILTSTFTPLQVDPNTTISELITKYNPDHVLPDKIVHEDTILGKTLTYGGLRNDASRCAWGLRQLGLKEGDVVCVVVPNSTDFVLLAHSVWWAGATFSPLNTSYTVSDIAHSLDLVKPTHIAVAAQYLQSVQNALWIPSLSKDKGLPKIFTVLDRVPGFARFPDDIIGKTAGESIPPYSLACRSYPILFEYLLLQHQLRAAQNSNFCCPHSFILANRSRLKSGVPC